MSDQYVDFDPTYTQESKGVSIWAWLGLIVLIIISGIGVWWGVVAYENKYNSKNWLTPYEWVTQLFKQNSTTTAVSSNSDESRTDTKDSNSIKVKTPPEVFVAEFSYTTYMDQSVKIDPSTGYLQQFSSGTALTTNTLNTKLPTDITVATWSQVCTAVYNGAQFCQWSLCQTDDFKNIMLVRAIHNWGDLSITTFSETSCKVGDKKRNPGIFIYKGNFVCCPKYILLYGPKSDDKTIVIGHDTKKVFNWYTKMPDESQEYDVRPPSFGAVDFKKIFTPTMEQIVPNVSFPSALSSHDDQWRFNPDTDWSFIPGVNTRTFSTVVNGTMYYLCGINPDFSPQPISTVPVNINAGLTSNPNQFPNDIQWRLNSQKVLFMKKMVKPSLDKIVGMESADQLPDFVGADLIRGLGLHHDGVPVEGDAWTCDYSFIKRFELDPNGCLVLTDYPGWGIGVGPPLSGIPTPQIIATKDTSKWIKWR